MSTVVMLNVPGSGRMNTNFSLMAELVKRGEHVVYYGVEPNRQALEAAGVEYRGYANSQNLISQAHQGGLFSVMTYLANAAEGLLPTLMRELRADPPDYLLVDSMSLWGNLVQQMLKIPTITIGTAFVTQPEIVTSEQMIAMAYQALPKEAILQGVTLSHRYFEITQRLDRQYGTQSPSIVQAFANQQGLNILFTSRAFHPQGEAFDEQRYKFVGPSIGERPQAMPFPYEQLGAAPLIYVSLGTIFNEAVDFYKACFAAFEEMPYQVIMSVGEKIEIDALGEIPANFIVRPFVPQVEILQRAALFITHGGMNSISEALLHHVPVLIVPQHGDQFLVASRVTEVGAGLMLPMAQVSSNALRGMAMQLQSDPTYQARAQAIGESFKDGNGYIRAADEIFAYKQTIGL